MGLLPIRTSPAAAKNIQPPHARVPVGGKKQNGIRGMNKRKHLVTFSVNGGTQIHGLFPGIILGAVHKPNIPSTVAPFGIVGNKIQFVFVHRNGGMTHIDRIRKNADGFWFGPTGDFSGCFE